MTEPGGHAIEIRAGIEGFDRRFVIAHELAHLIFDRYGLFAQDATTPLPHDLVEQCCDLGALELLLPLEQLRLRLRGSPPKVALVPSIAQEAQCSVDMATRRICESRLWGCTFIRWMYRNGSFAAASASTPEGPAPDDQLADLRLGDELGSLARRAIESGLTESGREEIVYWYGLETYECEALRLDTSSVLEMLVQGLLPTRALA